MTYIPDDRLDGEAPVTEFEPETAPRTSLIAGASWILVSKIVAFAITTALPLILIRRMNKTEYGHYKQLFLILQTALSLLPCGMNMSLFYFIPRAKTEAEKGNVVLGVVIFFLLTTGVAGGCLIANPDLLHVLFHDSALTAIGRQIGFAVVPYLFASLVECVLVANGDSRLSAVLVILASLLRTGLILGAALIWGTISSILWCVQIVATLQCIWLLYYTATKFRGFLKTFHWSVLWSQLSYSLPFGLSGLLWAMQVDIDNYFVNHYFDAAMFAIYATGCFDVPLVSMLGDSVGAVLIPRVSSLQATNSTEEIISLTVKAVRGLAFAYAPIFAYVFLAANQLIGFLFPNYLASVPIFRINMLMVLLAMVVVDPIIRAYKSERFWMLRTNIALLALLAVALYFGTTRFGLIGAVTCVILVQYIARALIVWKVTRLLKVSWADLGPLKDVLKTMCAAAAAGLCVFRLLDVMMRWGPLASLLVCGVVFSVAYVVLILVFKVPREDEIDWVWTSLEQRLSGFLPGRSRNPEI